MEVSGQLHDPAALHPGKEPLVPLDRRLGGPQSRSGRGGEEKNSQPQSGIEPQNPDCPARSPALYWLSYHGFSKIWYTILKYVMLGISSIMNWSLKMAVLVGSYLYRLSVVLIMSIGGVRDCIMGVAFAAFLLLDIWILTPSTNPYPNYKHWVENSAVLAPRFPTTV
jgi:hypothetical protein